MDGTIYLIGKDGKLEEMSQQPYDKEDILQKYLEDYPNLLGGDQMNEAKPKRWLFISREMGVPKEDGGSDTWSLDHLFLDQDGILTLVEVKRSSDTRSRREVVAQMLDYAANAVVYWPIERIRTCFETSCDKQGIDSIERLRELLGADDSQVIEDFWEKTKTNLQAEKIRLVFVADQVQPELRRIVEFLNGQMDPAEVLAVEIPQYVGKSQRAVVPRVIGLTVKAETAKGKRPPIEKRDIDSFVQSLNPDAVKPVREIYKWANDHNLSFVWGSGTAGGFNVCARYMGNTVKIIKVEAGPYHGGGVRVYFFVGTLRTLPPFEDKTKILDVLERMNQIPGINIRKDIIEDKTPRYPWIPISCLQDEKAMKLYLESLELIVNEIEDTGQEK
jgi:hypothetical protein